jgi:hypothetical protein
VSAPSASDEPCAPIIDLSPPSPAVRASVERFVLDVIARGVLVDLGLLPGDEDVEGDASSIK